MSILHGMVHAAHDLFAVPELRLKSTQGDSLKAGTTPLLADYFFFPGSMALSRSIRPGLAAGVPAGGLEAGAPAAVAGLAGGSAAGSTDGFAAGPAICFPASGLIPLAAAAGGFSTPGNGVDPLTTLAAESVGTDSLSFLTRIETLRLEGSVGLFFTRNIWSA